MQPHVKVAADVSRTFVNWQEVKEREIAIVFVVGKCWVFLTIEIRNKISSSKYSIKDIILEMLSKAYLCQNIYINAKIKLENLKSD